MHFECKKMKRNALHRNNRHGEGFYCIECVQQYMLTTRVNRARAKDLCELCSNIGDMAIRNQQIKVGDFRVPTRH